MSPSLDRLAQLDAAFPQHRVDLGSNVLVYRENSAQAATKSVAYVALHGIGSGAASWLDVALHMGNERFIAWDAPGYGQSSGLALERPWASDYAAVLEAFLSALQIERCVLIGHSLGALMAAGYLASVGTHRIAHTVLLSPARGYGANAAESERVRAERIHTLESLGLAEMARLRSGRLLSEFASDAQREWVRWNMANLKPTGYRQAIELLCGDDMARYAPAPLPSTPLPVSVYCGAQDVITPPSACAEVAQQYGTQLTLIERAGHASPTEAGSAIAQILLTTAA